jgi:hypothetical protein
MKALTAVTEMRANFGLRAVTEAKGRFSIGRDFGIQVSGYYVADGVIESHSAGCSETIDFSAGRSHRCSGARKNVASLRSFLPGALRFSIIQPTR